MANDELSKRDQTLPLEQIDEEYVSQLAINGWERGNNERTDFLQRRELYEDAWRNLTSREAVNSPWDNSANFMVPTILIYGKAIHARLWQLFSSPSGFYSVFARREVFKDKEGPVKEFMDFIMESYANSKHGTKREFDKWLWDLVMDGSGYIKAFWKREEHEYSEVVPTVEVTETLIFDGTTPTGRKDQKTRVVEKEILKTEILETPYIKRILYEDIILPVGESDPQTSEWVITRCLFTDDDMKSRVKQGVFDKVAVEESIRHKESFIYQNDVSTDIKQDRRRVDGIEPIDGSYDDQRHVVYEWYGKAYIKKQVEESDDYDLSEFPKEIVAWVHRGSGRVLGWTYLWRVSPGGIRPIFKSDFVTFPERTQGVGVAELLYDNQRHITALSNLRFDNGTLASTPMGFYRASSGLRPGNIKIKPGQLYPVDDVNDVRITQFPFLQGFGYQEEALRNSYAERLLSVSELQLGLAPDKVGALRNATGANLLSSESNIQLQIHFDRIADCVSNLMQFLFRLCRERVPSELYYRVTSDTGSPIFGKVRRQDLSGDFDFKIKLDILGQSELERQQQSVLMMQTLISPAFMQTGVTAPKNIYQLAKNFLKSHKIARVDDYLSKPQDYEGDYISPQERLFRLAVGLYKDPPIEDTVQLSEDHTKALDIYNRFKESDEYGLLTPEAVVALNALEERHNQMLLAQQSGGNPNVTGMQVPRDGFAGITPQMGGGGETLQSPNGEPNGPVV
jgi:hypothetical protein